MKGEKSYELHAAWEEGHRIGRLIISHDRRGQMIAFEYEEDWLEKHPGGSMRKRACLAFWKMLHRTDGDGSF